MKLPRSTVSCLPPPAIHELTAEMNIELTECKRAKEDREGDKEMRAINSSFFFSPHVCDARLFLYIRTHVDHEVCLAEHRAK